MGFSILIPDVENTTCSPVRVRMIWILIWQSDTHKELVEYWTVISTPSWWLLRLASPLSTAAPTIAPADKSNNNKYSRIFYGGHYLYFAEQR